MTALRSRYRFTVADYHRMAAAGILGEDDRVELIEGEIFEMSPIGREHVVCVNRFTRWFVRRLGDRVLVSVQNPVRLGRRDEPQPDVVLLRPQADDYATRLPGPRDVLLIVEVADTSVEADREDKLPRYARAGIPEVWRAIIGERAILVHRRPRGRRYLDVTRREVGDRVSPQAFPSAALPVSEIFRNLA